ncbi:hypothetical protein HMPREF9120_01032 [Neisseria sp. oral taxon 020 str. F0370]|nr:hypothetical protein HMPREF9120_01032 [Neisseria sp. oral taxon 020 str. F0370]
MNKQARTQCSGFFCLGRIRFGDALVCRFAGKRPSENLSCCRLLWFERRHFYFVFVLLFVRLFSCGQEIKQYFFLFICLISCCKKFADVP